MSDVTASCVVVALLAVSDDTNAFVVVELVVVEFWIVTLLIVDELSARKPLEKVKVVEVALPTNG